MPVFTAPRSFNHRLPFREAYSLSVVAPWDAPDGPPTDFITAYIVPDHRGCFISRKLAERYDPLVQDGDHLRFVVIEHTDEDVIYRFPLVVPVQLRTTRDDDFLQIGMDWIQTAFQVEIPALRENDPAEAEFMRLIVRRCIRTPLDPNDGGEVVA